MRKTLVVAGHGMVGHRLVEIALDRGLTAEWDVVVLAEEDLPAYDRVALSSWFDGADGRLTSYAGPVGDDLEALAAALAARLGRPVEFNAAH